MFSVNELNLTMFVKKTYDMVTYDSEPSFGISGKFARSCPLTQSPTKKLKKDFSTCEFHGIVAILISLNDFNHSHRFFKLYKLRRKLILKIEIPKIPRIQPAHLYKMWPPNRPNM